MSEPEVKPAPRVARAIDVITAELMSVHDKDRSQVIEGLNKYGLLSGGVSKLEKQQQKEHEDAVKASDEWVDKVRKEGMPRVEPAKAEHPEPKKETKK